MKSILIATLITLAAPAHAQVYKCKEGATTVFSAQPCAPNAHAWSRSSSVIPPKA